MSFALVNYNGLTVLSPDPAGDFSLALNNDLKTIADFITSTATSLSSKADKVSGGTTGDLASLTSTGDIADANIAASNSSTTGVRLKQNSGAAFLLGPNATMNGTNIATATDCTALSGGTVTASPINMTKAHADSSAIASNYYAHADSQGIASGQGSHADSNGSAGSTNSHADSAGTASAQNAHADSGAHASGINSHAGAAGLAQAGYSSALAGGNVAAGSYSHADSNGYVTGTYCHSDSTGSNSGFASHADSSGTVTGAYTHANSGGIASSSYSCAVAGGETAASYSFAQGLSCITYNTCQAAQGSGVGGYQSNTLTIYYQSTNGNAQLYLNANRLYSGRLIACFEDSTGSASYGSFSFDFVVICDEYSNVSVPFQSNTSTQTSYGGYVWSLGMYQYSPGQLGIGVSGPPAFTGTIKIDMVEMPYVAPGGGSS
jgi:hypothetical protein